MDMGLVMAAMTAQTANLQSNVAMRMIKMNNDSQAEAAQVLLGAATNGMSQANLAAGVGGRLDVSA
ncbi:hypothetical protein JQ557_22240 [Bradyrhizobium sp. U87765 SZCCT0131]|uniref:hypothetical protein n=1 Tax=unclassified Bradyrhizobium TaxID=2631580 RepID=UPI001BAA9881|nr:MULTISPECIES: hypothetical protein [unclassified Bradyrhizobium]MBR1220738.1 hypothetical protein [Bradyrhizobium sp. U87765 SZCCT0131]MBR1260442.1 hypothetical protein [Bradyrhizobium sp. U87765 SZCCT0134]MBR1307309.1 hypothetical protein [Bradyrhizobium sp. U87765 SZCCT0110]MBR1321263.1 hypothetical protein [Bradyrhizobium sp. U87765 SZCCT0109]MBR1349576.1 hypothetical protein [Bradyrhizobium sp. U87765 SZCCT0048]